MPISFPHVDHVHLERSPLAEVVCQVKFPPILKLIEDLPAAFQDKVRERFPKSEIEHGLVIQTNAAEGMTPIGKNPPIYKFSKLDEQTSISLSMDFFSLSTAHYTTWEDFSDNLRFVADTAIDVYQIRHSVRIGLRYVNALNQKNTGLTSFYPDIIDMLQPELTSLLRSDEIQSPVLGLTQVQTPHDDSVFSFRSGIVSHAEDDAPPQQFLLDFDFFVEAEMPLNTQSLIGRCENYHSLIYDAFRWCIREDQIKVFDPKQA